MTAQTTTQTLSITATEAEALLDWVGNSAYVDSDVAVYDGGVDRLGEVRFGFTADVLLTPAAVATALVNAATLLYSLSPERGSFVTYLATDSGAENMVRRQVGVNDGHSSVQVVVWNVDLTEV